MFKSSVSDDSHGLLIKFKQTMIKIGVFFRKEPQPYTYILYISTDPGLNVTANNRGRAVMVVLK